MQLKKESLLEEAQREEHNYQWEKAAGLYEQIAKSLLENVLLEEAAKVYYKLGDICLRAVLASETKEDYLNWDDKAVKAFLKAENLFNQVNINPLSMGCKAKALYAMSYVITSVEEARKDLKKSVDIFLELKEKYSKANDKKNCVRLSVLTIESITFFMVLCKDPSELTLYSQMARNLIEKAWILLKENDTIKIRERLLWGENMVINFNRWAELTYGDEKQKEILKRYLKRCEETLHLAENCDDYNILGGIYGAFGFQNCIFGGLLVEEQKERVKLAEKGFELLEKSITFSIENQDMFLEL
jgi:tetratricopeptide (TPR) repeat protein